MQTNGRRIAIALLDQSSRPAWKLKSTSTRPFDNCVTEQKCWSISIVLSRPNGLSDVAAIWSIDNAAGYSFDTNAAAADMPQALIGRCIYPHLAVRYRNEVDAALIDPHADGTDAFNAHRFTMSVWEPLFKRSVVGSVRAIMTPPALPLFLI